MKLYKLTDTNDMTRSGYPNSTVWEENRTHTVKDPKPELCSCGVLHAYKNLNLGLLLNPIHANIKNFHIWECEGNVKVEDFGKVGCYSLTSIKRINIPNWYKNEETRKKVIVQFAILCAEYVLQYFEKWNSEDNGPKLAIQSAKEYLNNNITACAADAAAAYAAADAAYAAADDDDAAACAAADAAYAAAYAAAAYAAADAAYAAADDDAAACAAADAAYAAAYADKIDFCQLADLSVSMQMGQNKC